MKHLAIVTRNLKAGGAERVVAQLAKHMVFNDIHCTIITLENEEIFYSLPPEVRIEAIGKKSPKGYIDKLLKYKEVRQLVKVLKPDVVLALPEEIGIYVIPALFGVQVPVVVSERNNPWIMPWKKVSRFARKLFYPFAAGFIFQTEQAASFFSKRIRKKGVILPNPLDLERIPQPWEGERRKEIVGAGRLEKQKNFPLLIRAFAKFYQIHPDYKLIIYGEGELRGELESLASSLLPNESYYFPGKTQQLLEKMCGAAMFVLSSDYEGMPNVVIEAMAMGMPVISTDCPSGGSAALIKDGWNGMLVPVNDIDEMYKAMCKIAESKSFGLKLGMNALQIKEKLDATVVAEQWKEYLKHLKIK